MGFVKNIMRRFGFVHKADLGRAYNAGLISRFTSGWSTTASQIDRDVKAGLVPVRTRARSLARNNPYVVGYLLRKKANIVGPEGFNFQWKVKAASGNIDEDANKLIEEKFKKWMRKENCTMRGIWSFIIIQQLIVAQWKRDGEFIVRMIKGPAAGNPFGFSLDLLETDDIDETYNASIGNNIVKMGVELDQWRRPVAFWLKKKKLQDDLSYSEHVGRERIRVLASEIIFGFDPEHPKQTRAVSPLAQVMLPLYMGQDWEDASLTNAQWSARLLGFYEKKRIEGDAFTGDESDTDGSVTHEFEKGSIEELPFGYEFQSPNRQFPDDQHAPFLKSILRKVATGMGLSYNALANDLEGVNFSSMRHGLNEERDTYKLDQVVFREMFLITVVEEWLKWALLAGALKPYAPADYERLNEPDIRGRRWGYIDPVKDVTSNKIAVEEGFKTRKDVIEEYGGNKDDIDAELEKDLEIKKELELGSKANIEITETDEDNKDEKTKLSLLAK